MVKFINKIEVKELFGYYNYMVERKNIDEELLLIIYGDNGCGKTTLLELAFNLLSIVNGNGQKTKIANIKFKEFIVTFDGDIKVMAIRGSSSIGSYHFIITEKDKIIEEMELLVDSQCKVRFEDNSESDIKFTRMLKYIEDMNVSMHYLTDKRKLYSDNHKNISKRKEIPSRRLIDDDDYYYNEENIKDELLQSILTLEGWIKKRVLESSRKGEKNINTIYSDLIKRVINNTTKNITQVDLEKLKHKLIYIRDLNKDYSKYGLSSKIETKDIENTLNNLQEKEFMMIYNILEPYIDGLESRLNSLKNIQNLIEFLISNVNKYFTNKELKYDLSNGFSIFSDDTEEKLLFTMLSSGERQLLLLFSNIITSSDNPSIFIIDEPEISLNIKWQRKLISTLIKLSNNSKIQFILATHSIELLTNYKSSVNKLEHIIIERKGKKLDKLY